MARDRQELRVLLHGEPVAQLRAAPDLQLQYGPRVVNELGFGALLLSAALPVASRAYKDSRNTRPPRRSIEFWCEGLLPEGEARTLLESRFDVRRGDTIGLLAAIGADCAGAVSFLSDDQPSPGPPRRSTAALDAGQLAAAVEDLPSRPLGVDEDVRVSIGGLQAKLLLTKTETGWARPGGGHPSTHILKPDPRELKRPGLVAAEALTLRAARLAGISAAEVQLVEVGDRLAVIVERYDRYRDGAGEIRRAHQEDGCQALGLNPTFAGKYQNAKRTAPTYADLARLLVTHAVAPDAELLRLGQQMTLSWAVGNTDGHARNFSILIARGVATLAPAYDVAPTHLFVSGKQSGLWIDDQPMLRWITRGHLVREMSSWGVSADTASDLVEQTLASLCAALPEAAVELGKLLPGQIAEETLQHVTWAQSTAAS